MPRAGTTPPDISAAARRKRLALEKAALDDYYSHGGKVSIRAIAARHPGVNRTTLSRRINGTHKPSDIAFQHLQRLNPDQEAAITSRVESLIDEGKAPDLPALTRLANEELQRGIDANDPGQVSAHQAAGELGACWSRNFLKRHPDLEVKRKLHSFHKAEATAVQKAMGELAKAYYIARQRADLLEEKNRELRARLEQLGDRRGGRPVGSGDLDPETRRRLEGEKKEAFEEKKMAWAALKGMGRGDAAYDDAGRRYTQAKLRHAQACKAVNDFIAAQGDDDDDDQGEQTSFQAEQSYHGLAQEMQEAARMDPALAMQGVMRF
ncbi:hypothetical protein CAC42_1511 [Sphaceloma murrayae]|uniref:Uncharacterized protein n=1 Tax=Sphaceloma murrayae TaxID=2082308 RepID=A0A2K1R2Y4_9PEZI|nr:hypothetical protein CAC42_1511 [Sphaceloma murrayae]